MSQPPPDSVRLPSDDTRDQMMVQAAKLYYDLSRTQNEIAEELGLNRWQVARLIQEARECGIVHIEIKPRAHRRVDLEVELQRVYGLREAIVVPMLGSDDDGLALESVAYAAGKYLEAMSPKARLFGVSWGRTMAAVAHWLPPHWNDGVHVVLVNGSTTIRATTDHTHSVAEAFARAGKGTATILPVLAVVGKASTREALEQDPTVAGVLTLAHKAPVVCFAPGALSRKSVLVESGYLTAERIDALEARGAVGDILGRFIDAQGQIVDPEIDSRTLGIRPEALRTKERSIAVASGRAKHRIVKACVKAGYANVLITDEATAAYVLEAGDDD
jgi:deoxyribonucleoside regulator